MDFQFRDIAEATAKTLALQNDQVRYLNDIASGVNTVSTVANIMALKDQYNAIIRWMVIDQLIKGGYTPEDELVGKICRDGIKKCDKALEDCTCKAITDKIMSEIARILSH